MTCTDGTHAFLAPPLDTALDAGQPLPGVVVTILSLAGDANGDGSFAPGDRMSVTFSVKTSAGRFIPIEELDGKAVGLTVESDTSVNLLKVVLAKAYRFSNEFLATSLPYDEALRSFPALLLIGDKALQAAQAGAADHVAEFLEVLQVPRGGFTLEDLRQ